MINNITQRWVSLARVLPASKINVVKKLDIFLPAIRSMLEQYEPQAIQEILDIFIKYRVHFLHTREADDALLIVFARLGKVFSYKAHAALQQILEQNAIDVNHQNIYKYTAILYVLLNNTYKKNPISEDTMALLLDYGADFEEDKLSGPSDIKKRIEACNFYNNFRDNTKNAILHSFENTQMSYPPLVQIITDYVLLEAPCLPIETVQHNLKSSRVK